MIPCAAAAEKRTDLEAGAGCAWIRAPISYVGCALSVSGRDRAAQHGECCRPNDPAAPFGESKSLRLITALGSTGTERTV